MCLTVAGTLHTGLYHSHVCLCFTVKIFDRFKQITISNILYCNFYSIYIVTFFSKIANSFTPHTGLNFTVIFLSFSVNKSKCILVSIFGNSSDYK